MAAQSRKALERLYQIRYRINQTLRSIESELADGVDVAEVLDETRHELEATVSFIRSAEKELSDGSEG